MSKYLKSQDFTQEWGWAGSPSLPYIDGKLGVVANYAICERAYYNIGFARTARLPNWDRAAAVRYHAPGCLADRQKAAKRGDLDRLAHGFRVRRTTPFRRCR